jgi:hypothetical protein
MDAGAVAATTVSSRREAAAAEVQRLARAAGAEVVGAAVREVQKLSRQVGSACPRPLLGPPPGAALSVACMHAWPRLPGRLAHGSRR